MATFFPWSPTYSTGIETIDTQHKKLVEILNKLYDAMTKSQGNKIIESTLSELVTYTVTHFATEERLFKQHGYPEGEAHKKAHDTLKNQVKQFQEDLKSGNAQVTIGVSTFLKEWLTSHIMKTDMKYVQFMKSKGVK